MFTSLRLRLGLFLVFAVAGLIYLLPMVLPTGTLPRFMPQKRINLGLDLQGGLHLELKVQAEKAVEQKVSTTTDQLGRELRDQRVRVKDLAARGEEITLVLRGTEDGEKVEGLMKDKYPFLKVNSKELPAGGDATYKLAFTAEERDTIIKYAIEQGIETIRNRIDQFGVAEPVIVPQGNGEIMIQLPGLGTLSADKMSTELRKMLTDEKVPNFSVEAAGSELHLVLPDVTTAENIAQKAVDQFPGLARDSIEPTNDGRAKLVLALATSQRAKKLIGQTAQLEFRLLDDSMSAQQALSQGTPSQSEVLYGKPDVDPRSGKVVGTKPSYLVGRRILMGGTGITDARMAVDQNQAQYYVHLEFDRSGSKLFGDITSENVGKRLAIVLDGVVQSAPVIRESITGGRASISGTFTRNEARDLAIALRSGSLPAPVSVMHEIEVGASLGDDSVHSGMLSLLVAFVAISAFMAVYYKWSGVLADGMLLVNIVLTLATLTAVRATLTMPGIAGIVLTMGMSVDTNVLIFERIREELRMGRTIASGVSMGFSRAFLTIFDAHMTTLIAAAILGYFGTGPIRGFAVTLAIGLTWNLFTAVVGTRVSYDIVLSRAKIRRLSI